MLIQAKINELIQYINLWNIEYALNMTFHEHDERHAVWSIDNVLVTGVEVAPALTLCEFDNFNLQGSSGIARIVTRKLTDLLRNSFAIDNTAIASRIYEVSSRQAERTLRAFPASLADLSVDIEAEVDFKIRERKKNPAITEDELGDVWQNFCFCVEKDKAKRHMQEHRRNMTAEIAASAWFSSSSTEKPRVENKISILFLSADPSDETRLRLGEEFREIQEKLKLAKLRERFKLELPQLSARPVDLSQALLDVEPQIVHFSGHGISTGALYFENQTGQAHLVEADALASLFEHFAAQVNCVILNACYSEKQANVIAEHIEYVIGMSQAIGDKAAIAFSIGFYQALGGGRTIEDAYKLGCVQIGLQGISKHLPPVLFRKGQIQFSKEKSNG